ncbi:potassium transporter TrkH [Brevirhabdus pacifica]|uniref:Potassium transporter TrkH n=1 Tax=Brevirhabdus pacifica TaxID=1267768 RepID=A0A1U7DF19_9RHOB|nr:potassium transporter TrkG [Brevirhabdus pacifica]APX88597.1 potassium transporter TrkH [Brevirhabdus pacifica]OWU79881.1 potassium transporter TrkH [Loktanella sp. 22II-4b]PJJ86910.1 trk system potassium uptake protein TrkH [Brevirhabdus pacifica]
MRVLFNLPVIVLLMGIGAVAMFIPSLFALAQTDYTTSRVYFYFGTLFLIVTGLIGLATANYPQSSAARSHLLSLLGSFTLLPLVLAVPMSEAVPNLRFVNVYFEMLSSLTTTGATIFQPSATVPDAVHLWRGLVGWMGGFLIWLAATAILAPLNLGGFEVTSLRQAGQTTSMRQISHVADPTERLVRFTQTLLPLYSSLTVALWILLIVAGGDPYFSVMAAMATMSTSGIMPPGGVVEAGFLPEFVIAVFFIFALSRQTFASERRSGKLAHLRDDPELRLAAVVAAALPVALFLRHWYGAIEVDDLSNTEGALRSLWGAFFTVVSFLSTTGFVSADWDAAQNWSGLQTPGLILMGLALVGGGVATTAGGVKLLRVYALYSHGVRELEKLVHPSSVGGAGRAGRSIRRQGAYIAWIFFMLFALSIALIMTALTLTGLGFEPAMVLTIASLSTTGPIAQVASQAPIAYATLPDAAKFILMGAMVLGRLETLAIIALLNPDFWRS